MANINTCCADRPCQHKRTCEVSYLEHLISLYRDISADTTIPADDKAEIISKIYRKRRKTPFFRCGDIRRKFMFRSSNRQVYTV